MRKISSGHIRLLCLGLILAAMVVGAGAYFVASHAHAQSAQAQTTLTSRTFQLTGVTSHLTPSVTYSSGVVHNRFTEFALPIKAYTDGIVKGSDGTYWINGGQSLIHFTTWGRSTLFALPPLMGTSNITIGPDKNLWFQSSTIATPDCESQTCISGYQINRLTADGTLTTFALPTGISVATIALGPDNALWSVGTGTAARFVTSGTLTVYWFPDSAIASNFATFGADGSLWFTEGNVDKIARMTTKGLFTEFALSLNSIPTGIASGPDHALWFIEQSKNKIGRMTTTGQLSEFSIPTSAGCPSEIANVGGNSLAFTEACSNLLGIVKMSGAIQEFKIPSPQSDPSNLTGDNGTVWFIEIGSINTAHSSVAKFQ